MSESKNEQLQSSENIPSQLPKPSGIKPPSSFIPKVTRICSHHDKKPELPVAATPTKKSELNNSKKVEMRRQSDDYKTHHLPDVSEESEYDLMTERFGYGYEYRSSKSKSPDSFRSFKYSPDRKSSSGVSSMSPDFFEATGRRSSSDHGAELTTDTDSFMIGQRVYVGGVKPGRITFIGEVHFAPGEWAGIVLDEPEGKNDGAVSGKRYFQCEPKKGIFSRLTRLTREPFGTTVTDGPMSMDFSYRSFTSPLRTSSGNTSPTQSVTSTSRVVGSSITPEIGDRVIVKNASGSRVGVLRFRGETQFASGDWCGVEFEDSAGKNDGSVNGVRYFKCAPMHGIFVPSSKIVISPMARKMRLSRQNSQESLTSNITLNSLASTNTSKLRMNATQKRLSTLNKPPSATSTPKPSFSLQDILREKSNHIEQIMKERDIDREEMSAQTILYQKNLNQYKEKVAHLQKLLEDERKKAEDLQFSIHEAEATSEEKESKETTESTFKKKIAQLEDELKRINSGGGGDFVDTSQLNEIARLKSELDETTKNLHISEGLKDVLQKQIQSLHEQIAEMKIELDLKSSADLASEEVLKTECNYLQGRINELENESESKSKDIEVLKIDIKKLEESRNEELTMLENQMKERVAKLTENENKLIEKISDSEKQIAQLKETIERLTSSDVGAQEIIKTKDFEIQKLSEDLKYKDERMQEMSAELERKIDEMSVKEKEIGALEKSFESLKSNVQESSNKFQLHVQEINEKSAQIVENNKQIESLNENIKSLRLDIKRLEQSLTESTEALQKSQESEKAMIKQISDLSESKIKLENDLTAKDNEMVGRDESIKKLTNEIEELNKCMNGLNIEVECNQSTIKDRDSTIEKLTKDFNELKECNQKEKSQFEELKKSLEIQIDANSKSTDENIQKLKADYDAEKNKLRASIEEMKHIAAEKNARIEVMDKNASLLTQTKEKLEKNLEEIEKKLSESSTKLAKIERDDAEKANQLEKLLSSLNETTKKLQDAEVTIKKLEEDKKSIDIDNKDLNRKLGAQEEKIAQLTDQKLKLQGELEKLKNSSLDANSELKQLSDDLNIKQNAFEAFQVESERKCLALQRQVDELENQRDLSEQNCTKLKNELHALHQQKIENENQLNLDLSNIKMSTEEERANLERQISTLRSTFENEKADLKREIQNLIESSENYKNEVEAKMKSLKEVTEDSNKALEGAKKSMRESESRLSFAIDELKSKEANVSSQLMKEREASDELKSKIEELEAAKDIQKNEYEEKLHLEKVRIAKLEADLMVQQKLVEAASAGNEEKIKYLEEIKDKNYKYEQNISDLGLKIQNEISSKKKLEESIDDSKRKMKELEEEQIDLVNRKEEYKNKTIELEEQIKDMLQRRASLDEKLQQEKKVTEIQKTESDMQINEMQQKINEFNQQIAQKDFEKDEIIKRLQLREDEIKILQEQVKEEKQKLLDEIDAVYKEMKAKDDELTKITEECSIKETLLTDLRINMENFKSCLNTMKSEKSSSSTTIQDLNDAITKRDAALNDLQLKLQQYEASLIDKEHQLKNMFSLKDRLESESKLKIDELMEQISLLEEVKQKEVGEMAQKMSTIESQLSIYQYESEASKDNDKIQQELLMRIKDLEMSETELQITNQTLKRQLEEMQVSATPVMVPPVDGDKDLVDHIEFLNSIIADMHKKNLKLSKQIEAFESGGNKSAHASFSGNDFDLKFLEKKKKPPPRMYCDICEEFDQHETEDCPTQCSEMDLNAPPPRKDDKPRKLPPPRKYCDICEIFDAHETEECPQNDESY